MGGLVIVSIRMPFSPYLSLGPPSPSVCLPAFSIGLGLSAFSLFPIALCCSVILDVCVVFSFLRSFIAHLFLHSDARIY